MAPREFNSKLDKIREMMKDAARDFLTGSNKDASLLDYMTSFMNTEGVLKDDFDKMFYYIADGYYAAKGENFEDNQDEVKKVYKDLSEPLKKQKSIEETLQALYKEEELIRKLEYERTANQIKVESNEKTPKKKGYFKLGLYSHLAIFPFILAIGNFIASVFRLINCNLLNIGCLDDETEDLFKIPWGQIGFIIGIGFFLVIIDQIIEIRKLFKRDVRND